MTYKLICDHCNMAIEKEHESVKIDVKIHESMIYRHYHLNCFNYKFSTDIRKIEDNE